MMNKIANANTAASYSGIEIPDSHRLPLAESRNHNPNRPPVYECILYSIFTSSGYLTLRNDACCDTAGEIGPLWNGSEVLAIGQPQDGYVPVTVTHTVSGAYGENLNGCVGYVNADGLQ